MPGTPGAFAGGSSPRARESKEQQAVLNRLRAGRGITGARPANPVIGGIQSLFGGAGAGTIPTLNAARLGGQEVLMNRGGWDTRVAGSGSINVGGQTWYPAQSGQDLVYKRAPGNIGGQYGSIFSTDQLAPTVNQSGPKVSTDLAGERAYLQEKNRVAQLAEQDVLSKKYRVADLTKAYNAAKGDERERLGMEIFALTNPGLAKIVKPGQAGYETIQATRRANTPFGSALNAIPSLGATTYQAADTLPTDNIVSKAFGGASDGSIEALLSSTPDVAKGAVGFTVPPGEQNIGGMSITNAFTSPVFNPSQDNLSNLQLSLLKEAFNKRIK